MEHANRQDMQERFELIEKMMLEARRTTEYWGWNFVLWGTAYLIAIAWAAFGRMPNLAWPVTMIAAGLATTVIAKRKKQGNPGTVLGRAMMAIWTSMGVALFVFCFATSGTGHWDTYANIAAIESFLGAANMASGILLRWRAQATVGILWWAAAIATCFVTANQVGWIFIAITIVGMIGFGLYLMVLESKAKSGAQKVAHA
jgi:multisubunit Na+/H+ antiporter MnhB subunit